MRLWVGKVPFENKFNPLPFEDKEKWEEARKNFEFRAVPMLEIDGMQLVETDAINKYVSERIGITPKDIKQKYLVNSALSLLDEMVLSAMPFFKKPKDEKEAALKDWVEGVFDPKAGYLEKRLKENVTQEYMVGDSITEPDI